MNFIVRHFISIAQKVKIVYGKLTNKKVSYDDDDLGGYKDPKEVVKISIGVLAFIALVSIIYGLVDSSDIELNGVGAFNRQKGVKFGVTQVKDSAPIEKEIDLEKSVKVNDTDMCFELHQKVRNNQTLNPMEFSTYKTCLRDGKVEGLTERQKKLFETLADPASNLTEKEREIVARSAEGLGSEEDDLIADGLVSDDPLTKQIAKALANDDLSPEDRKLLEDVLKGSVPKELGDALLNGTEEEKALAREIYEDVKNGKDVSKQMKKLGNLAQDRKIATGDGKEIKKELDSQLQANQKIVDDIDSEIKQIDKELDTIKDLAKSIEDKKKRGITLTPEEQAILDEYERLLAKRDSLKAKKNLILERIANINVKIHSLESGDIEGAITFTKKLRSGEIEGEQKGANVKLSPSEYRLVKKISSLRKTGFEGSLFPNQFSGQGETVVPVLTKSIDPDSLITYPPDLKVACISLNNVVLSKKTQQGQMFTCQIEDNILHPETSEVIIAKGAIAVGETVGFDTATEMLSVKMKTVRSGSKVRPFAFKIVSYSGVEGVRGSVLSTKGIRITASVLMELFSGVVQFFTNQAQVQLAQQGAGSMTLTNGIVGGTYQGVSSGLNRTSEMLAQELQDAPEIYITPQGHKLFLVPAM